MLVFFEMAPQQNPPNQQPVHPNDHLIPVANPAGPSPVIKVPRLPGVEQPSMIRVEQRPQEQPMQQPSGGINYGNIAKSAALVGGGLAAGALAHHFFNHNDDNNEQPQQNNTPPPTKVSTPQSPPPSPKPEVQKVMYTQPAMQSNAAPSTAFYTARTQPALVAGRSAMIGSGQPHFTGSRGGVHPRVFGIR